MGNFLIIPRIGYLGDFFISLDADFGFWDKDYIRDGSAYGENVTIAQFFVGVQGFLGKGFVKFG